MNFLPANVVVIPIFLQTVPGFGAAAIALAGTARVAINRKLTKLRTRMSRLLPSYNSVGIARNVATKVVSAKIASAPPTNHHCAWNI